MELRELTEELKLQCYKVVGDQTTVQEYVAEIPNQTNKELSDWGSMLYFQFNEAHALGTLGYRWSNFSLVNLIRLDFILPRSVLVLDDRMAAPNLGGKTKAALIKETLGESSKTLLCSHLESSSRGLICKETDREWELVVPKSLLDKVITSQNVVASFKPNEFGCTGWIQRQPSSSWSRFDDSDVSEMVNEPPVWLQQLISRE